MRTTLEIGAFVAVIVLALLSLIVALHFSRFLLAPIGLAIAFGLMLGPLASQLERHAVPVSVSALAVVVGFFLVAGGLIAALAAPLSSWAERLPHIWQKLQLQLSALREPVNVLKSLRDQVRDLTGDSGMAVAVTEGSPVESVAVLAPALIAQFLIFLASLYFFIATRHATRATVLRLCYGRRLRWRVAHIFRDVETAISHYLLSIAVINLGLGLIVALAMAVIGVPSPLLWGALAALLNFIIYVGPAIMAVLLFGVGLAISDSLMGSFAPPLLYLSINALEAQFVTPTMLGQRLTLNPFIVFLAIAFWLWLWGPAGGFIAIPALLASQAVAANILPGFATPPSRKQR